MKFRETLLLICALSLILPACGRNGDANRLYPIVHEGNWGYIDNQGKIVIEPQFGLALDFHEGLALVMKRGASFNDDQLGYIDRTGKFIVEPKFRPLSRLFNDPQLHNYRFSEGLALIHSGDKTACLDKTGKTVFELDSSYFITAPFSEGLAPVMVKNAFDSKNGYIDMTGKIAIEPKFALAEPFSNGVARVAVKGSSGQIENFGYIDKTGKTVIEAQFKDARNFSDGLALASTDGSKFGYIDKTGKFVIGPQYESGTKSFQDGLALVRTTRYKYIDKSGQTIFEPQKPAFEATSFSNGLAWISNDGAWQIIDKTGKVVGTLETKIKSESYPDYGEFKGALARISFVGDETGTTLMFYTNQEGTIVWSGKWRAS